MSDPERIPLGWLCPRCGHVWGPQVSECTCKPEQPGQPEPAAEPVVVLTTLPFPALWYETRVEA